MNSSRPNRSGSPRQGARLQPPSEQLLFVFAGEASGDQLGADLLLQLRQSGYSGSFWGVGGERLVAAGMELLLPMESFQLMGFVGVIAALPRLARQLKELVRSILARHPATVVLIDFPDFNLRLAGDLRRAGYQGKIVQYVCPTVWAWRAGRIGKMAERLDLLLTLFPFEPPLFDQTGLPAHFVGHPAARAEEEEGVERERDLIGLFPGSRSGVVELNLPLQLQAARHLAISHPELRFVVSVARPNLAPLIEKIVRKSGLNCSLDRSNHPYRLMQQCQAAFATSGTVTLELALHEVPTVVTYRPSLLNALIARFLFRLHLPHYCIVNILAQRAVFPERVHWLISAEEVGPLAEPLLLETAQREACLRGCREVRQLLQAPAGLAAECILALFNR